MQGAGPEPVVPAAELREPDVSWAEVGRVARRPRILLGHLVVIALAVTMVELGRWQWSRAHVHHGDLTNYGYAFQWWLFVVFGLAMWVRILRDKVSRAKIDATLAAAAGDDAPAVAERRAAVASAAAAAPAGYRAYVMPLSPDAAAQQGAADSDPPGDGVLAGYNAYLARYGRAESQAGPAAPPSAGVSQPHAPSGPSYRPPDRSRGTA